MMRDMFWLTSSPGRKIESMFASHVVACNGSLANVNKEESSVSDESIKSEVDFPICTAFSPSAKAIKIPTKYYSHQQQLNEKRLSLDSGYAESNLSSDGKLGKVIEEVEEKQVLERHCEKCHRKMSVKFDFDKMESEGDPEAWVLFNCSMCTSPVEGEASNSEDEDLNDAITDQFDAILQDVTVYYSKKLDMYRIKMEHHQRTRPDKHHYELAFVLMEMYEQHPNHEELWKDMFCRILDEELALPIHATSIQRWMQEELQIKAAMKACINDLRRERDKVNTQPFLKTLKFNFCSFEKRFFGSQVRE